MLPTLDEEKALPEIYNRIPFEELKSKGYSSRVVIVDGGSKDNTLEIAKELGCEIIEQWGEGKGIGIRQGFEKFLELGDDELVMLDCDGTYHPEEIVRLVTSIPESGITIGDRLRGNLESDAMTSTNWIGNQLLTWLAVALHGKPINDLCSGFWAFSRESLMKLQLNSMRFEIEAEMYTSCAHLDIPIRHIPITYSKRVGEAKLGSIKDGTSIARKLIIRRIFPTPHEEK
jgi:dolichol-phosphate mannosyltransferase